MSQIEIPPGTLDMLVLQMLHRHKELHGFEIAEAIERVSADVFRVEEGSLYPALQRLLIKGYVQAEWGRTAENRRARYYSLLPAGKKYLAAEVKSYEKATTAIARILQLGTA
ncbi:MAG: PadR family transcriptional regulator [Gemmatimonas sp.]